MCHLDVIFSTFFLGKKNGAIAANLRFSRPFFFLRALCAGLGKGERCARAALGLYSPYSVCAAKCMGFFFRVCGHSKSRQDCRLSP